jgi:hypothetical protein
MAEMAALQQVLRLAVGVGLVATLQLVGAAAIQQVMMVAFQLA